MKRVALNLIVFACAIAAPHLARAQATCPPTIKVEQQASAPAPDWTVTYSGYETAIAGVTVFDGPPADEASLVPDSEKTAGDYMVQTWKLTKSDRGYWLQCNYANTTAQIARRLPADVARCDVTYDRNMHFVGGALVVKSVNCK
ncbi:MAG: STY0301 family protein [Candidatus Binatus sp.]